MRSDSSARNNRRNPRKKLIYVRSLAEVPDFRSDDEIAAWYQTHSTVLIQDQLEAVPAKAGGKLRERILSRRYATNGVRKHRHSARPA